MKSIAGFCLSLLTAWAVTGLDGAISGGSGSSKRLTSAAGGVSQISKLKVCIDDTDCENIMQEPKFVCLRYLCYPPANDSVVVPSERKPLCKSDGDCPGQLKCWRHHNTRQINHGICFESNDRWECSKASECRGRSKSCCANYCCESKYYADFVKLPCLNDWACKDMNLGNFCCPPHHSSANNQSVCCNVDPKARVAGSVGNHGSSTVELGGKRFLHFVLLAAALAVAFT